MNTSIAQEIMRLYLWAREAAWMLNLSLPQPPSRDTMQLALVPEETINAILGKEIPDDTVPSLASQTGSA